MLLEQVIRGIEFDNKRLHPEIFGHGTLQVAPASVSDNQVFGKFKNVILNSVFQPIASPSLAKILGHEALLRGKTVIGGKPLSPADVFLLAATSSEAVFLDRLIRTLHALNFITGRGYDHGKLFLNIDSRLINQITEKHGYYFEAILSRCGKSTENIVLELIENSVDDDERLSDAIKSFKSKGFLIAIDDFGRHHSNFDRLWRLEPDIVKLDKSLIQLAGKNHRIEKMLIKLVELIHELGAKVLVEGIETEVHLKIAQQSGADYLQGFWIACPSPSLGKKITQR